MKYFFRKFVLCGYALFIGLFSNFALAQESAAPIEQTSQQTAQQAIQDADQQLVDIRAAISISETRRQQLRAEIEQMNGDRTRQNTALIAAAQRVKLTEIEVSDIEERLSALLIEQNQIKTRLEGADVNISNLLAAVQRIGNNPPPALIIDPSDALNSARSASLLAAILPQLRQKADIIIADLKQLETVQQATLLEKQQLSARFSTLFEEQLRIATLIEARKIGAVRIGENLAEEEARAEELARNATNITELVQSLKQRVAAVAEAVQAQELAEKTAAEELANAAITPPSDQSIAIAFTNTQRQSPAVPFPLAKGHLAIPAAGVIVTDFGADDGFGGKSQGISIVTRAEAQIVSPADGWVMYKGPYLNYGQIIILNPGNGHTILLAGLNKIDIQLGQFILLGEPIGTMGSRIVGSTNATSAGVSRPTLYIELRNLELSIDPAPWWRQSSGQASANVTDQNG